MAALQQRDCRQVKCPLLALVRLGDDMLIDLNLVEQLIQANDWLDVNLCIEFRK